MNSLIEKISVAESLKPKFGDTCNRCGWCCLTEPCNVAISFGVSKMTIPCPYLNKENDKDYSCELVKRFSYLNSPLAIGEGCDAKTQNEVLAELNLVPKNQDKV